MKQRNNPYNNPLVEWKSATGDLVFWPEYCFKGSSKNTQSTSPTAVIDPTVAIGKNPFVSTTSPYAKIKPKVLVLPVPNWPSNKNCAILTASGFKILKNTKDGKLGELDKNGSLIESSKKNSLEEFHLSDDDIVILNQEQITQLHYLALGVNDPEQPQIRNAYFKLRYNNNMDDFVTLMNEHIETNIKKRNAAVVFGHITSCTNDTNNEILYNRFKEMNLDPKIYKIYSPFDGLSLHLPDGETLV